MTLNNTTGTRLELPNLELQTIAGENESAKFDLTIGLTQTNDGLAGSVQYNRDLFDAATIQRFAGHFQRLLDSMVHNSEQKLGDVMLLSADEQYQLLVGWNETAIATGEPVCLHELIRGPGRAHAGCHRDCQRQ